MWADGDYVELRLPMRLRLEPMPDDESLAAVAYGPVVLAGRLGHDMLPGKVGDGLSKESFVAYAHCAAVRPPAFVVPDTDPATWVEQVDDEPLTFRTKDAGRPVDTTLVPFYRIHGERYGIYWEILTPGQLSARQEARAGRGGGVIDCVVPGDEFAARAHNFQSFRWEDGHENGRAWIRSNHWFRYDLDVDRDRPVRLRCAYLRETEGETPVELSIDGAHWPLEELERTDTNGTVQVTWAVPVEFTHGKTRVAVRFNAPKRKRRDGVGATTVDAPLHRFSTARILELATVLGHG
jgi:hypothetical protein